MIAHPPVFKIFDLTRAEKKARRDDLSSRERNQVATAEHIGQSPLSRYEDLITGPARSPLPNGGGDAYEGLCCAASKFCARNVVMGHKRTSQDVRVMSALPPKADIG